MSKNVKLPPDMEFGDDKMTKKEQMRLANVPGEDNGGSDSEVETETDNESTDTDSDTAYECNDCNRKFSGYIPFRQHIKGKKHAKMVSKKKVERKLVEREAKDEVAEGDEHLIPEPYAICKVCDKEFPGPKSYHLHLRGKTHRHKVLEASVLEQVRENGEINEEKLKGLYSDHRRASKGGIKEDTLSTEIKDDSEISHEEFECRECHKVFNGLTPFAQHVMSKTHAKQVEKKKILHEMLPEPSDENAASDKTKHKDLSTLTLEDDILVCKLCSTSFNGPENAMLHLKSKNHAKNLDKYVRKLERKKEKKEAKETEVRDQSRKEIQKDAEGEKEEQQQTSNISCKSDASHDPTSSEAVNPTSVDEFGSSEVYEKYKKYKEVMNSLKEDDVILK